jgi:hypothetical protein
MLPLDDANGLRELLIEYAANTKDHTVSDSFVQLLRTRRSESEDGKTGRSGPNDLKASLLSSLYFDQAEKARLSKVIES